MGVRICDTMLRLWGVAGWQQVAEGAKRGKRDGRLPGMGVTEGEGLGIAPDDGPGGGCQRASETLVCAGESVFGLSCTCSLITPSSSSRLLQYH